MNVLPSKTPAQNAAEPAAAKKPAKAARSPAAKLPLAAASKTPPARRAAPAKSAKPLAVTDKPAPVKSSAKVGEAKEVNESKHPAKKPKLVRDSFTFPAADYALIGSLKQRSLKAGHEVKKSELLRAGLAALSELSDPALLKALQGIDRLKPGRPLK